VTRWFAVPLVALAVLAQDTVTFRTVAKGTGESSVERRVAFTFKEQRRWNDFWKRVEPDRTRPRVDFSKHMLIAVTQGRKPSGGHSIRITRIDRTGDGWLVHVTERSPGRGCFVTHVVTRPYHVVRVARTGEDVSFDYRRVKRNCSA
jgi:hypothetical protein